MIIYLLCVCVWKQNEKYKKKLKILHNLKKIDKHWAAGKGEAVRSDGLWDENRQEQIKIKQEIVLELNF